MITEEQENYIRFILLLLQVGSDLLREITEKALQGKGQALCQFLNSVTPTLLNDKRLTRIQKDILYPRNPQVACIRELDITLLSFLLINYLKGFIDKNEIEGINDIRDLRNNYHAHAVEGKMDSVTFEDVWNHLSTIIGDAGKGLSPEVQQRHLDMTASIKKDQLEITVVAEQIKKMDQSIVFFENIQTCLDHMNKSQEQLVEAVANVQIIAKKTEEDVDDVKTLVQNTGVTVDAIKKVAQNTDGAVAGVNNAVLEMKDMLNKIKERTENQGRITKVVHTVYGKVYLSADEQETVDHAEAALIEASNNSIAKEEPTDSSAQALQDKVNHMFKDIENLDVKVVAVEKGSVVYGFECYSINAIQELIDYFYSLSCQRSLNEIANALEDIIGKKISIAAAEIDRQSIQDVITKIENNEYEKVVQFELSCTGVDGLLHALQAFEEGSVANSVNELSKALSESIGKPVTLHTTIDMDQMRYAIKSMQDQLDLKSDVKKVSSSVKELTSLPDSLVHSLYTPAQILMHSAQRDMQYAHIALVYKKEIHLKGGIIRYDTIYACTILSDGRLLIADNEVLNLVNIDTGNVEQKKTLDTFDSDIAVLPNNQVAVTLPWDDKILILSTTDMSIVRRIPDVNSPSGITYHQDELYVVTKCPCVNILNLQGDLLRKIECDELMFCPYSKIAVSMDAQNLYITDYKSLIKFSAQGQVIARYRFTGTQPKALTLLGDGSLLVISDTIHHISADLQQGYKLKLNEKNVRFIGVDPLKCYVIYKDTIQVYDMQKQESQWQWE